jgi:hypothetical protein
MSDLGGVVVVVISDVSWHLPTDETAADGSATEQKAHTGQTDLSDSLNPQDEFADD